MAVQARLLATSLSLLPPVWRKLTEVVLLIQPNGMRKHTGPLQTVLRFNNCITLPETPADVTGPVQLQEVVAMALDVLEALAQLHHLHILNLNLKPDNIMLMIVAMPTSQTLTRMRLLKLTQPHPAPLITCKEPLSHVH